MKKLIIFLSVIMLMSFCAFCISACGKNDEASLSSSADSTASIDSSVDSTTDSSINSTTDSSINSATDSSTISSFVVTFMVDGTVFHESTVNSGAKVATPAEPTKPNNEFVGWFENESGEGAPFDFDTEITSNKSLYAKFKLSQMQSVITHSNGSFESYGYTFGSEFLPVLHNMENQIITEFVVYKFDETENIEIPEAFAVRDDLIDLAAEQGMIDKIDNITYYFVQEESVMYVYMVLDSGLEIYTCYSNSEFYTFIDYGTFIFEGFINMDTFVGYYMFTNDGVKKTYITDETKIEDYGTTFSAPFVVDQDIYDQYNMNGILFVEAAQADLAEGFVNLTIISDKYQSSIIYELGTDIDFSKYITEGYETFYQIEGYKRYNGTINTHNVFDQENINLAISMLGDEDSMYIYTGLNTDLADYTLYIEKQKEDNALIGYNLYWTLYDDALRITFASQYFYDINNNSISIKAYREIDIDSLERTEYKVIFDEDDQMVWYKLETVVFDKDLIQDYIDGANATGMEIRIRITQNIPTHEISFFDNAVHYTTQTILELNSASEPTIEKDGYIFLGWYENIDKNGNPIGEPFDFSTPITKDLILYACFDIDTSYDTYTLNFYVDGVLEYSILVPHGCEVTFNPTPIKEGYEFIFWVDAFDAFGNPIGNIHYIYLTYYSDTNFYAYLIPEEYVELWIVTPDSDYYVVFYEKGKALDFSKYYSSDKNLEFYTEGCFYSADSLAYESIYSKEIMEWLVSLLGESDHMIIDAQTLQEKFNISDLSNGAITRYEDQILQGEDYITVYRYEMNFYFYETDNPEKNANILISYKEYDDKAKVTYLDYDDENSKSNNYLIAIDYKAQTEQKAIYDYRQYDPDELSEIYDIAITIDHVITIYIREVN